MWSKIKENMRIRAIKGKQANGLPKQMQSRETKIKSRKDGTK